MKCSTVADRSRVGRHVGGGCEQEQPRSIEHDGNVDRKGRVFCEIESQI